MEPKLIYKYTHAQALAGGELRLLPNLTRDHIMTMPIYVGYQLDAKLKKAGITDDQLREAIKFAFNDKSVKWRYGSGRRYTNVRLPVAFDIVPGTQIGDDEDNNIDEHDDIMTLVNVGET